MAELYTVRMKRKVLTYKYDAKGKLESQREEFIEECYHSLPQSTALMYQAKFPDAFIEIIPTSQARQGTGAYGDRAARRHESTGATEDSSKFYHSPKKRGTAQQARKGGKAGAAAAAKKAREATYADALNAAMGSAA